MEIGRTADDRLGENGFPATLFAAASVLLPLFVSMRLIYGAFGNLGQKRVSALARPTCRPTIFDGYEKTSDDLLRENGFPATLPAVFVSLLVFMGS